MRAHLLRLAAAGAAAVCLGPGASAQGTLKIGELNSYKAQPAFLDPYRKGWEMAIEEINAKGGVIGKKLEVVSRDDGANPGDAVRVANELVTREGVNILAGTFLSHIGLAVTELELLRHVIEPEDVVVHEVDEFFLAEADPHDVVDGVLGDAGM